MGQVLHGSATTTETIRRAIQNSQESIRALAQRYNINPKTVAKWKKRPPVKDHAMGPKQRQSSVLTSDEEALIVAFRKQTLLPLSVLFFSYGSWSNNVQEIAERDYTPAKMNCKSRDII